MVTFGLRTMIDEQAMFPNHGSPLEAEPVRRQFSDFREAQKFPRRAPDKWGAG